MFENVGAARTCSLGTRMLCARVQTREAARAAALAVLVGESVRVRRPRESQWVRFADLSDDAALNAESADAGATQPVPRSSASRRHVLATCLQHCRCGVVRVVTNEHA